MEHYRWQEIFWDCGIELGQGRPCDGVRREGGESAASAQGGIINAIFKINEQLSILRIVRGIFSFFKNLKFSRICCETLNTNFEICI